MAQISTREQGDILVNRLMNALAARGMTRNPAGTRVGNVYRPNSLVMADGRTLIIDVSVHKRGEETRSVHEKYWTLVSYSIHDFNGPSRSMGEDGYQPNISAIADRIMKTIREEMMPR